MSTPCLFKGNLDLRNVRNKSATVDLLKTSTLKSSTDYLLINSSHSGVAKNTGLVTIINALTVPSPITSFSPLTIGTGLAIVPGDFLLLSDVENTPSNNGLFQVLTYNSGSGVTTVNPVPGENFTLTAITAGVAEGTATHVFIGVIRVGLLGTVESASGSASPLIFTTLMVTNGVSTVGSIPYFTDTLGKNLEASNLTITGSENDLNIPGQLLLANTTSSTTGVIKINNNPVVHSFGSNNFFVGPNTGNFTLTSQTSTGVGPNCLYSLTNGDSNVGMGFNSGRFLQDGDENVTIGAASLAAAVSVSNATSVGTSSLRNSTSGTNTSVGSLSCFSLVNGNNNASFGRFSLTNNIAGNENASFGENSLTNFLGSETVNVGYDGFAALIDGQNNTSVGHKGFPVLISGNNNSNLGKNNGSSLLGNNNTTIGVGNLQTASNSDNNVIIGTNNAINSTGSNVTVIGNNSGNNLTNGSNIIYFNNPGDASDLNTIRIGNNTDFSDTFISGIYGNDIEDVGFVPQLSYIRSDGKMGSYNIGNAFALNRTVVSATPFTPDSDDYILGVTLTTTSAVIINLPTASIKRSIKIVDEGGNAFVNNITVTANGADLIVGAATYVINGNYNSINIYSNGSTQWFIA